MVNLKKMIERGRKSSTLLYILNIGLNRVIPFNKPHGFKILKIGDDYLTTFLPHKKRNFNHIKGIHACALATQSEFTTGLCLLRNLDSKKYRIILKTIHMDYHYQGKTGITATFKITKEWLNNFIIIPLQSNDSILVTCKIETYDSYKNHISTGNVEWQIKEWRNVKTKVK